MGGGFTPPTWQPKTKQENLGILLVKAESLRRALVKKGQVLNIVGPYCHCPVPEKGVLCFVGPIRCYWSEQVTHFWCQRASLRFQSLRGLHIVGRSLLKVWEPTGPGSCRLGCLKLGNCTQSGWRRCRVSWKT